MPARRRAIPTSHAPRVSSLGAAPSIPTPFLSLIKEQERKPLFFINISRSSFLFRAVCASASGELPLLLVFFRGSSCFASFFRREFLFSLASFPGSMLEGFVCCFSPAITLRRKKNRNIPVTNECNYIEKSPCHRSQKRSELQLYSRPYNAHLKIQNLSNNKSPAQCQRLWRNVILRPRIEWRAMYMRTFQFPD